MKKFGRLLVPIFMLGILVVSGCASPEPGSAAYNSMRRHPSASQVTGGGSTSAPVLGTSFQPTEKMPADKAVVYIYRPVGPMFGADIKMPFEVKANGKVITALAQGGYYAYVSDPGNIEFGAFDSGFMAPTSVFSIIVEAKAGQAYYLKGAHGKGMAGRAHLESVSPEVGANEIANCKVITAQ